MSDDDVTYGSVHGTPVDDAQIETWAAEAEAGYELPALQRRGRGRPVVGAGPGRPVTVRLDDALLAALNARAKEEGLSGPSEAIRAAIRSWAHVA